TAETVEQLALEVETLNSLESMALCVLRSGVDSKWSQLNLILDDDLMLDAAVNRRKLIIFTEQDCLGDSPELQIGASIS
ncbi:hypothetical protein ACC761_40295, partial [Rhizobium ruizarguesonis]